MSKTFGMQYEAKIVDKRNDKHINYKIDISLLEGSKKEIIIDSKKLDNENNNVEYSDNSDPVFVLEIAKTEYDHCIKRLDRLDNKVYILITVCAFVFVMLTNSVTNMASIKWPGHLFEAITVILYLVFAVFVVWNAVKLLKDLINCLSIIKIHRLDDGDILDFEMFKAEKNKVAEYVIGIYENARQTNNDLIDKKYDALDRCVGRFRRVIVCLIILSFVGSFLPKAREGENRISDAVSIITEHIESIDKTMDEIQIQ